MVERPADIIIDLPLPSDLEHPNARPHFRAKAKAIANTRHIAYLIADSLKPKQPFRHACYRLTFWLQRKRDYDGLGAWVKAQIDGIVDAGVLVNDSEFRPVGIMRYSGRKATNGKTGVRFEIWEEIGSPDENSVEEAKRN